MTKKVGMMIISNFLTSLRSATGSMARSEDVTDGHAEVLSVIARSSESTGTFSLGVAMIPIFRFAIVNVAIGATGYGPMLFPVSTRVCKAEETIQGTSKRRRRQLIRKNERK